MTDEVVKPLGNNTHVYSIGGRYARKLNDSAVHDAAKVILDFDDLLAQMLLTKCREIRSKVDIGAIGESVMKQLNSIVIVDDDANFLEIVKTVIVTTFSALNESCIQLFSDPIKAINYIKSQPQSAPSLLITDINMAFPGDLLGKVLTATNSGMEVVYYSSGERPCTLSMRQTYLSKTDLYLTLREYLVNQFML